jgi:signal transduction histidine kinase
LTQTEFPSFFVLIRADFLFFYCLFWQKIAAMNTIKHKHKFIFCFLLALIFAQKSWGQTATKNDPLLLLQEAIKISPQNKTAATELFNKAELLATQQKNYSALFNVYREKGFFGEENNDLDAANDCYLKAEQTAFKSENKQDLLTIYTDLAILSRKSARYIDCKNYHNKALELAERTGDQEIIEDSYHGLGFLFEQTGDYEKAVSYYLKSLELTQKRGETDGEIVTLQQIGKTYSQLNQHDLALENIKQAENLAILTKNDSLLANVQHDFGEILVQFGEYDQALAKLNAALNTYRKIDYKPAIASSLVYIGEIHERLNHREQTIGFFKQAMEYEPFMDNYVKADLYLKFGKTYLASGRIADSQKYFQQSMDLASANEYNKIVQESAEELYILAEKSGNASLALGFLEISTKLKDSIFNVEKTKRAAELKLKYDNVQKERDIQTLRFQQDRTMLIGSLVLLLLIAGFLTYIARMSSRNNLILEQKNREIQHQNTQLTESNEVLRQYAYVAAHDLKEPLRTICSFVNLLEIKFGKKLDPEAVTYMQFVSDSAKRMNTLLTDLLEYSSIFNQKPGREAVPVKQVLDEICFNLKGLINQKNAEISYADEIPALQMSRVHLVQIFQNLVGNALKFVPNDRQPNIRITHKSDAKEIIFAVRDNGMGIEEQHREKIFNLFYRLQKDESEIEGTGIGLSICKSISEKYGGRIWYQSVLGQGTTFFFSFPNSLIAIDKTLTELNLVAKTA